MIFYKILKLEPSLLVIQRYGSKSSKKMSQIIIATDLNHIEK